MTLKVLGDFAGSDYGVHLSGTGLLTSLALVAIWSTASFLRVRRWRRLKPGTQYPPHVWSWIPYLGSALDMTHDHLRNFILKHSKRLGNAKIFTATIAGSHCAFIADTDLVYLVFKDSILEIDSLSLQKRAMMNVFGETKEEVKKCFVVPEGEIAMKMIQQYFVQNESLESTLQETQEILFHQIEHLVESKDDKLEERCSDGWSQMSLLTFCRKVIFFASVGPVVSKKLMDESFMSDYTTFEKGIPFLFAGAPSFVTRKSRAARVRLLDTLENILVNFKDSQSDFMKARHKLFQGVFDTRLMAKGNLGMLLASIANSIPAVFWTMCNILENEECYRACREAVIKVAALREPGRNWFTLKELDDLPILKSAFMETLRLYQIFFIVREVEDDFIVNSKGSVSEPKFMLTKGTTIMALPNLVHMDPDIFEEPTKFQYDRFVDPNARSKKGTLLTSHWKPFGGGAHLCPGRKFITYEFQALLAMILLKIDMRFAEGEGKPSVDLGRQGASVAQPKHDPTVEFCTRKPREAER